MANSLVFSFNPSALLGTPSLYRPSLAHSSGAHRRIIRRNHLSISGGMKLPSSNNGGEQNKEVPRVTSFSNVSVSTGGGSILPVLPTWTKWLLGSIICLAFPLYKKVSRIEDKMEKAAETTTEVVEKVAETAKKVAFDIADALPDNSKLKQEVLDVERFAERVDKGAKRAEEFILKADHITDEVDELVAPMIEEREKIEKDKVETIVSSSNVL